MINGGNTTSFIIVIEDKGTEEVLSRPITHFLSRKYHRNSGSVNTELTVAQIIVSFLNFVLDKVNQKLNKYNEIRGLEDLRGYQLNLYITY